MSFTLELSSKYFIHNTIKNIYYLTPLTWIDVSEFIEVNIMWKRSHMVGFCTCMLKMLLDRGKSYDFGVFLPKVH